MGDISQMGGFRTIIIGSTGWLQEAFAWIPNPAAIRSENQALRDLNRQLSAEVIKMRKSLIENQRLKNMLNLKDTNQLELISAEVIGKNSIQMRNYITLNKGKSAGIHEGMSVRTDAGLVGTIIGVSSHYSFVELLDNRNVKISAKILRTQIDGIIGWEGGEYLILQNIPTSFDVKSGDVVITSNYSNKYPQDVPIGKILRVEKDPGSLFHKIIIEPFAQFNSLEQVFIIKYVPDPERLKLIESIEERLMERKKSR